MFRLKSLLSKLTSVTVLAAAVPVSVIVTAIAVEKGGLARQMGADLDRMTRENLTGVSQDVYSMCATQLAAGQTAKSASLREAILARAVGAGGYVFVLAGSGDKKGTYIISKDGARDGENIWEAKDADGNAFIQRICQEAVLLKGNSVAFMRYPWQNKGETKARYKVAAITYFAPWDWVIGASAYEDEFTAPQQRASAALNKLFWVSLAAGVLALACTVGFGVWLIVSSVAKPVQSLAAVADRLAVGEVDVQFDHQHDDEIGRLAQSMRTMADNIREQAQTAQRIGAGDLSVTVTPRSERDVLAKGMASVVDTIRGLVADLQQLSQAAVEGKLSTRAEAAKYQGGYRDVIQGINKTLDAVVTPIGEARTVLERVAERDLTVRMRGQYQGDHAKLEEALNQAIDNLDEGLHQVAEAVGQVAAASAQIGTGSQSLAQGAGEQAAAIQEVSSSLQEMASVTRQNSNNAKEARGTAEGTREGANRCLASMNRMSEAMQRIKASSDSTAKIVKTIDEIAFQTNLLALNAAVEAARAGDAGKGFAVVADEVRNLSMRSAEAAKNTANLIEESVKNAESGVQLNAEVLERLQEINARATKVGEVMNEITGASEQQTTGIDQITTAVDQVNQVTQHNAASSEESASAAQELSAQAEELRSMVGHFRLTRAGQTAVAGGRPNRTSGTRDQATMRVAAGARRPKTTVVTRPGIDPPDPETILPLHDAADDEVLHQF